MSLLNSSTFVPNRWTKNLVARGFHRLFLEARADDQLPQCRRPPSIDVWDPLSHARRSSRRQRQILLSTHVRIPPQAYPESPQQRHLPRRSPRLRRGDAARHLTASNARTQVLSQLDRTTSSSLPPLSILIEYVQAEDEVLITFQTAPLSLTALHLSLTSLSSQTGFCALLELVHLSADGKIVRGSWTPVGNGTGQGRKIDLESGPVYSSNPFAALGGGGAAPAPRENGAKVWGSGSLVGASFNKVG